MERVIIKKINVKRVFFEENGGQFPLKQKINMCTTAQIKHRTSNDGNTVLCGVCSFDKRPAVKINGVNVCHDCLKFVNHRSKLEGNSPFIQLDIDTRYVASNTT